ncbi:hypothetical protein LRAMOSA08551 [Lichtheimia ramosa]|uniref:Uncharacterized protein n=1 Tax=Lichtheimia ramosa TaxID=688394 RepID=A0A077WG46_9FUNG|nr:hypothetical protein LRAMOSA08551 [Lichtheimia ramosa]
MSKQNHPANYYYTYTSPASSAPPANEMPSSSSASAPPSYEEAVGQPTDNTTTTNNKPTHVPDATIPAYNPAVVPDHDQVTEPLLQENDTENDNPFRGRPAPPTYSIYRAPYETSSSGEIITRDQHLNQDGEAILQFLHQHNSAPKMAVRFYGYHEETHWRTRSSRDNDGNWVEEREPVTTRVDDFCFQIDCSEYVSPQCIGMYVTPDKKTGQVKTVRQLCDDYVHEHNKLKELRLTKVVDWNYPELTRAFTAAIRAHGYYHSVEISFEMKEYRITIKSGSDLSRLADNKAVRFLFFITCLWILVWPVLWFYRKHYGHNTLQSKWRMTISERDWYNLKVQEVLGQVRHQGQAFGTVPFILG